MHLSGKSSLQFSNGSVTFSATLTGGTDLMATLFNILTTDRLAGQDAGMRAHVASVGFTATKGPWTDAHMVNGQTIAPAGRRTRC
jgi:hypothetical protein